jgi:hypothetical protein
MKSMSQIKIYHILYVIGTIFVGLYLYGTIEFAVYSFYRWGRFEFDVAEQIGFLYALISPFVLAYHIHRKNNSNPSESRLKIILRISVRVLRVGYLITIGLMPLVFTIAALAYYFNDFSKNIKPLDIESFLILSAGLLSAVSSFFIIKLALKYK